MPKVRKADVVWVEPKLVAEVEFVEWTHDGRLRAPSFQGLREDKPAREVHREEPLPDEIRSGKRVLKLSNLDKVFWPEEGITKGDLLAYYRAVAPVLLPHLQDRPFTMKRYPDGSRAASSSRRTRRSTCRSGSRRVRSRSSTRETAAADAGRSRRRSSTTSSRCSGW